jgi:ribonuclease P protein component
VFSFDSSRRLISKQDFDNVFQKSKKIHFGHVTVLYKQNTLPFSRLGFAISKRWVAKAVLRNKLRRIFKESFRICQNLVNYDIVVLANKPCKKPEIEWIKQHIEQLWQKLKIS